MDDIRTRLNQSNIGCSLNNVLVYHLMYADDTCIIAPSPCALHQLINICVEFSNDNFVKFNDTKSNFMCFKPGKFSDLHIPIIKLNNEPLSNIPNYKYLGIFINDQCCDNVDISRHVRSVYTRGNMFISRFKNCSDDVKVCLFTSFLSNIYGCSLWYKFRNTMFKKAAVAYNNVFRKLLGIKR